MPKGEAVALDARLILLVLVVFFMPGVAEEPIPRVLLQHQDSTVGAVEEVWICLEAMEHRILAAAAAVQVELVMVAPVVPAW